MVRESHRVDRMTERMAFNIKHTEHTFLFDALNITKYTKSIQNLEFNPVEELDFEINTN